MSARRLTYGPCGRCWRPTRLRPVPPEARGFDPQIRTLLAWVQWSLWLCGACRLLVARSVLR